MYTNVDISIMSFLDEFFSYLICCVVRRDCNSRLVVIFIFTVCHVRCCYWCLEGDIFNVSVFDMNDFTLVVLTVNVRAEPVRPYKPS